MSSNTYPLSGDQKNAIHEMLKNPPRVPDMARTGMANPHLRVFVVNFDGTSNNRDRIPKDEQPSLVAKADDIFGSSSNPAIISKYYRGVGTGSGVRKMVEIVKGAGCTENAEAAHKDLAIQAAQWIQEDPDVKIHVHVTGFSRGAATALHFLNLVEDNGAMEIGNKKVKQNKTALINLLPTVVKTSAVLYDCVSTGQKEFLKLTVPNSCVGLLHLTAGGEERNFLFPLRSVTSIDPSNEFSMAIGANFAGHPKLEDGTVCYQRIHTLTIPGARHSDVGGVYPEGNLREVSDFMASTFQASLGLPAIIRQPGFDMVQHARFHDSRLIRLDDDVKARQESDRAVLHAQKDVWNGRFVLRTQFTGLNGVKGLSKDSVDKLSHGQIDLKTAGKSGLSTWMGQHHAVQIRLREPGDPHYPLAGPLNGSRLIIEPVAGEADPLNSPNRDGTNGVFSRVEGRLQLHGSLVPGLPHLKDIEQHLLAQKEQGLAPKPVTVSMAVNRLGAIYHAGQNPTAVSMAPPPVSVISEVTRQHAEPWPESMRACLMRLNDDPPSTTKGASHRLDSAGHSVAVDLAERYPQISRVSLESVIQTEKTDSGVTMRKNTYRILCDIPGQPGFSNHSTPSNAQEAAIKMRLLELIRGMESVSSDLLEKGFSTPVGIKATYQGADFGFNFEAPERFGVQGQSYRNEQSAGGYLTSMLRGYLQGAEPEPKKKVAARKRP